MGRKFGASPNPSALILMPKQKDKILKANKAICEKCGSAYVYIRRKSAEIVCRRCGAVTKYDLDLSKM